MVYTGTVIYVHVQLYSAAHITVQQTNTYMYTYMVLVNTCFRCTGDTNTVNSARSLLFSLLARDDCVRDYVRYSSQNSDATEDH